MAQQVTTNGLNLTSHASNHANTDPSSSAQINNAVGSPQLTSDQIAQLLSLLNKPSNQASDSSFHLAGISYCLSVKHTSNTWILDSGATDHITKSISLLESPKSLTIPKYVHLPDGSIVPVTHTGQVTLTPSIILQNVLFVPSFHHNLLSVSKLSNDSHCSLNFTPTSCIMQGPMLKIPMAIASAGTAGWDLGRNPVLTPVIYRPNNPVELRFEVQNSTSIPRMYHSTAILLRDGRILVSGSNPHAYYNFTGVLFPTDLTMETYSPDYLDARLTRVRPRIISPTSQSLIGHGQQLSINFIAEGRINRDLITVTMVSPPFTTHSFSMNQRLLVLTNDRGTSANVTSLGNSNYQVRVVTPGSNILAPPGYYLLFVVYREVPSTGIWVQIK
ncbi:hypothetical protein BUALT_BualtUnG0051900 [Buddleja alternifolia]|uniref:Galactose oxidase-like Early set domain-containing protein n=1 Tax=Buddleja alternifolia TaxID=168488 RepID=A0AAV6W077_9LAMI|nr:hypothetical protein BUALT_BualtUnG0051900 [Buddleja alternifolia]